MTIAKVATPSAPHWDLCERLRATRARTLPLAEVLETDQLLGPKLPTVNPPLWELGHLGWFQERWCLRQREAGELANSILPNADALYDSAAVHHDSRWSLALPSLSGTLDYMEAVRHRVEDRLCSEPESIAYFVELAVLHEDMHAEAFTYTRQTLGYSPPSFAGVAPRWSEQAAPATGDVEVEGGEFLLGAEPGAHFVFDNEKWAYPVAVRPFRIARTPVTNQAFLEFVEDGGYARSELWSHQGWQWRTSRGAAHPIYWKQHHQGDWSERIYDQTVPLVPDLPVMHVSWFEAEAWCRWAGRRLPSEAEWECAASTRPGQRAKTRYPWNNSAPDATRANLFGEAGGRVSVHALPEGDSGWGCRQMIGNVWEWTADTFEPYPGFVVDPYREYSAPWFGSHKVLRGGSHATTPALVHNTWRNFYTPDRQDVFAGFRTCAR